MVRWYTTFINNTSCTGRLRKDGTRERGNFNLDVSWPQNLIHSIHKNDKVQTSLVNEHWSVKSIVARPQHDITQKKLEPKTKIRGKSANGK